MSDARPAQTFRLLHGAMTSGALLALVVFSILHAKNAASQTNVPNLGLALAAASLAMLGVAVAVLRGKVPSRASDESADLFWSRAEARAAALVLWAALEGGTLVALVGFLTSGFIADVVVAAVGLAALGFHRPGWLERETVG
jgi:hypothetical protein